MDNSIRQDLTLRQQQNLTPLQLQYVRILEMNGPEVEETVREVLDENPALEAVDDTPWQHEQDEPFNESAEEMQRADYGRDEDVPDAGPAARQAWTGGSSNYFEPVVAERGDTLMEWLMRQLRETHFPEADMPIAEYIAGTLDDNGYMTRSLRRLADDMALTAGIDVTPEHLKEVWHAVRRLDPAGVGAVDLRDCLLLQLRRRADNIEGSDISIAITMIDEYFDLFSLMHYDRLRSALSVDKATMQRVFRIIRSLNPKPGALVNGADDDRTRQITPDFLVEYDPDTHRISVTLPNNLPTLQIEQTFAADAPAATGRSARETALFIRQRRDEASTFIQALSMRQQTLLRVMRAIVDLQRDFFINENSTLLKPMVLKDIAALTGDDLSVISRATGGKYVATQRGIYPLRFFFSERLNENTDASAHKITDAIGSIIKEEDKRAPLSDAAITDRLKELGYDLARRTVAKYRERMGIPVGRLRKKI